jgi:hypothetical protein
MILKAPNIGLQRTSACGLAAEAGSLGGPVKALAGVGLVIAMAGISACAERPPLSGYALQRAESCGGHLTQPGEPRTVHRVAGVTRFRENGTPLPDVDVVLRDMKSGHARYMARSGKDGRFDFGRVPPGRYQLRTCVDGYASVEVQVLVSRAAPASEILDLALNLDL